MNRICEQSANETFEIKWKNLQSKLLVLFYLQSYWQDVSLLQNLFRLITEFNVHDYHNFPEQRIVQSMP